MNKPQSHYVKLNKSEKKKYNMILLICGIYKTKKQNKKQKIKNQFCSYREGIDHCQRWWVDDRNGLKK